jgi:hypothetical protein
MRPLSILTYDRSQYSLIVGLASLFFLLSVAFIGRQQKLFTQEKKNGQQTQLVNAANDLIHSLSTDLKKRALVSFDLQRSQGISLPPDRPIGISLKNLNARQKKAVHVMLQHSLSVQGYLKVTGIMQIDEMFPDSLSQATPKQTWLPFHPPGYYNLIIFGTPSSQQPWGWRLEGHHLLLNFTVASAQIACAPMVLGVNPSEISDGPLAGWQVMGAETSRAAQLLASLDAKQRAASLTITGTPKDMLRHTHQELPPQPFQRIQAVNMTTDQREMLMSLIQAYVGNLHDKRSQQQYEKIRRTGLEELYFMWAGSTTPGEVLDYRIQGDSFIIELSHPNQEPDHLHATWRNLEKDLGLEL